MSKRGIHIRAYLTWLIIGIFIGTILVSMVVAYLLEGVVTISMGLPLPVWIVMLGVILGSVVTTFLGQKFLDPVMALNRAMKQVAAGDFSTTLKTDSHIHEIRDIYDSFNVMTQELRATEILQTDFVSNVSHEFKTPINAIEGYAMLLQDSDDLAAEEREEYIGKILVNTRRLSELVGNILLLSRVDNQAIQSKRCAFRLDEQIRQAIVLLESKWSRKEIEFEVDLEPVTYTGNESLLLHVWSNLIDNAIKFDPQGGLVRMELHQEKGQVTFSVEDNGCGIPIQAQKHIFDRFYQSDTSHREEGNGLGLALVKRILDTCGGTIAVESGPGGSRFTVQLPCQSST